MFIFRASLLSSYGKNTNQKSRKLRKTFYTSPNLRFHLVFCCFPSQSHFGAFTMKLSMKAITAHKKGSLQNTVRRLIIILLSLFFFLIIRASIWMPYGKNLPDTRQDQKDDQCAKYSYTPFNLRIHLVLLFLSSNRHFGTLTLKVLFNPITKKTMTNLQNIVQSIGIVVFRKCFAADYQSAVLELLL